MARIWFVSAPLHGHLDWGGFLKTARALKAQGHDVTWVSEAAIGGAVTSAGVPFAPVRRTGWLWPLPPPPDFSTVSPQEAVMLRYRRALDTWLSEALVADAMEALVELAGDLGKPDLIATDPFLSAAALAAEKLDSPLAVCGWPAMRVLDEEMLYPVQTSLAQESRERIERLCQRFSLVGVNFSQGPTPSILSPHLHISYFSEGWYQSEAATMLPQNQFVGGKPALPTTPTPQWLADIPADTPLALVTLGSVFTGDLGFFSWAAQAVARLHFIPVVVIGRNPIAPDDKAKLKAALPPTTRLLNWVDFDHVLPRTRLIIHHGGMGTTHAAIVHAIPQLVVPHAADQRGQARRVAQAKIGLNLTAHDVKNGLLFEGARALSHDQQVKANARELAAEFAFLGGPGRGAEVVASLLA
jgi:MGT family glycosyltransferase